MLAGDPLASSLLAQPIRGSRTGPRQGAAGIGKHGVGRHDIAEVGQRRPQPGRAAKAGDGEMREPRVALGLVDAEALEPAVEVLEPGRVARAPRSSRTSIATLRVSRYRDTVSTGRSPALRRSCERVRDLTEAPDGGRPEERERNVQVRWRDDADVPAALGPARRRAAPPGSGGSGRPRKSRACSCPSRLAGRVTRLRARLCDKSRRARCSATTVARPARPRGRRESSAAWRPTHPGRPRG